MGMLFRYHDDNIEKKSNKDRKGVAAKVAPKVKENEKAEKSIVDEIKSMSGAKLRKYAADNGVEDPEELTVGELKAILIEKLG